MRVLLLGGGAREHALAWKLKASPSVKALWAAPGNPGIETLAQCVALDPTNAAAVCAWAREHAVDLVVVGPEAPLMAGVADALREARVPVFGPSRAAANIEGSKAFAKEVMQAAGVPTARAEVFDDAVKAEARALGWGRVVVKADGLAAGKGVVVADDGAEAAAAVRALAALPGGKRLVLEERLEGPELSVIALCDGERYVLLPPAQDHKRLREGDLGPNTGGMGAYAPARLLSDAALAALGEAVIRPTLLELKARGMPFRGALFAGVMLTPHGPRVLEFNCRFGDPETQPLMMLLDEDLAALLLACAQGRLEAARLRVHPGACVGVVLAAPGYPEAPQLGGVISGLERPPPEGVQRFHAGTRREAAALVTSGGRVLTVCARGATTAEARARAYAEVELIDFPGKQLRRDIAARAPADVGSA